MTVTQTRLFYVVRPGAHLAWQPVYCPSFQREAGRCMYETGVRTGGLHVGAADTRWKWLWDEEAVISKPSYRRWKGPEE